jgi:hypothetical protein
MATISLKPVSRWQPYEGNLCMHSSSSTSGLERILTAPAGRSVAASGEAASASPTAAAQQPQQQACDTRVVGEVLSIH